jgi:hypothetical protein
VRLLWSSTIIFPRWPQFPGIWFPDGPAPRGPCGKLASPSPVRSQPVSMLKLWLGLGRANDQGNSGGAGKRNPFVTPLRTVETRVAGGKPGFQRYRVFPRQNGTYARMDGRTQSGLAGWLPERCGGINALLSLTPMHVGYSRNHLLAIFGNRHLMMA